MDGELLEQSRMREAIGRRMQRSKRDAPHFYLQTDVAVDEIQGRLRALNADGGSARVTMSVPLVMACARALRKHPRLNCVWTNEGVVQAADVNIGVAVALEGGVVAPALLNADLLGMREAASALQDLVGRARDERLRPRELSDATFTLSNLGMFDVTSFAAIVTPPQVAIMAAGRAVERVVLRQGEPALSSVICMTLSADHRVVDGVDGARFLETVKDALLDPDLLVPEALI